MVGRNNNSNNQTGSNVNNEKSHTGQQRSEQQPRNRSNYQRYNQGQRTQNQNRPHNNTQNSETHDTANKEPKVHGTAQSSHYQPGQRNNTRGSRTHEAQPRDNVQQRGYYRDRARDNGRDSQPRQHSATSAARYANTARNRAEETIDDIKLDIIRLEKEIELEMKEIRSLKL